MDIDAEDSGVLSLIGYNAQLNGPTDSERRRIIDGLFTGRISIPKSLPTAYVAGWRQEISLIRLRKIALSIASFTRQQKRKRNGSLQAVQKWESDLDYLKSRYYKPFASQFNWPST